MDEKSKPSVPYDATMPDYSKPNLFGDVRLFSVYLNTGKYASAGHISSAGWHKVNKLYHIERPSGAGDPLVLFTISGCGRVKIKQESFLLEKDEVCLIPPNEPCAYLQAGGAPWVFYWIHFTGDYAMRLFDDIINTVGHHAPFPTVAVQPLMEQCINDSFSALDGEIRASAILHRILETLLLEVNKKSIEGGLIPKVLQYLNAETTHKLSMDVLEEKYHYSKEHIIRSFRRQLGVTPYHYWRELNLARARQLLTNTSTPIADIAENAGFSSAESFSKQFEKRYGITPGRFRRHGDNQKWKNIDI